MWSCMVYSCTYCFLPRRQQAHEDEHSVHLNNSASSDKRFHEYLSLKYSSRPLSYLLSFVEIHNEQSLSCASVKFLCCLSNYTCITPNKTSRYPNYMNTCQMSQCQTTISSIHSLFFTHLLTFLTTLVIEVHIWYVWASGLLPNSKKENKIVNMWCESIFM